MDATLHRPFTFNPSRWGRPLAVAFAVVIMVLAGVQFAAFASAATAHRDLGDDFLVHVAIGHRFIETGQLYWPDQLAGPYQNVLSRHVLYPPTALHAFVPMALLPLPVAALAWWGIPAALFGLVLYRLRLAPWTWPLLALVTVWPRTQGAIVFGNSDMLIAAAVAAGVLWGWPAVLVLLKPSWFPLALLGVRDRSSWVALGVFVVASAALLPLWPQYIEAMTNLTDGSWLQRLYALPLLVAPLIVWLGRSRDANAHEPNVVVAGLGAAHRLLGGSNRRRAVLQG